MKNRKLSEKIKDLKQQLDQVTQDITDVHYENANEQIFNISLEKKEFLEKVNSEISRSLDILDEDNEKLFSKISYLKQEVEKALENFDKESHFLDLFKKFIDSEGNTKLLTKELESKAFDKTSLTEDEISIFNKSDERLEKLSEQLKNLELLNKNALKHLDSSNNLNDEQYDKSSEESENNNKNSISLNLFSEIHSIFELELKKINSINSNMQEFLDTLFNNRFLTKDQKIDKITGKITALKNDFNKKLNSFFNDTDSGGTKKETKIVKESYKNTINNSYLDLQNELINKLDKTTDKVSSKIDKKDSIIENGINYVDTNNLEELEKAISDVESKINLQKVKYSHSDSSKESLDYYLYLNHVDKVSVENEISKNYFLICEEFIKKLELKKEILQKLVENFVIYVNDNCNQMIVNISEKLESAQKNILSDDDGLSDNNFFAQKSIEFFENLKTNSNTVFNLLNEKFTDILKDVSLESLKTNTISFEYLSVLINDMIKEINSKVFYTTDLLKRELIKISELKENGLLNLKTEIVNEAEQIFSYLSNSYLELEEIAKDVEKNVKDNLKFKLNKLEQVYTYVSNYQENANQNDFEAFENSSNYVGVRLERLERQYSKIVNLLNPIAEKLSENTIIDLESVESRINSKIDQLISNIENNRNDDESKYSAAVNEILLSNETHKQNILNLIQSIEEEKINMISEESKKSVVENERKLSELEELINLQNQEIEALLGEKNSFIEEIEDILINKKHKLNDEKIESIKNAIQEVIFSFNERINDFEYNFDRKLSTINLGSLDLLTQKDQKELFEEIEKKLSNNYEVIKKEVKQDLFQVLNSINELNSKVSETKNNESYNEKFNEINNQFDQFRFLLKEVTNNVIDKNNKQYEEVNAIVENLNNKFVNLIEDLKDENIKSGEIIISKVSENTGKFKEEFDSSLVEISNKLSNIASDIENKNKEFEIAHADAIDFILETNRNNQKEILGYIKNIEDTNVEFLNEIEAKKYNLENSKLKNLEELIELQNAEIESLIGEKNNFVLEVEKFISNKKEHLTNENILRLEDSIQDVAGVLNAKIEDLEVEFGRKLQDLDLTSYFDYFDKSHNDFINSVQSQLSNNYEIVKNEIKNDIETVLDSVKEIPTKLDNFHKFDSRFNEIDSQFEQFRFILKNTTENILDKDSKTYKEMNDVINTLNAKFESLISELKDENIRTVGLLNEKISTSQEEVNRKIDSSVDLMDNKFETFLQGITEQNKYFETVQLDTIQSIIETNKINQKEILGYIKNFEQTNAEFLNEIEAKKYNLENLKLKELEELISLQNQEIESLLDEKEDFINEVENFISNKKEQLTNENILRLEDSIQDVVGVLNAKIEDLEIEFGRKLQDLDLTSQFDYFDKSHSDFINSVQSQLSNNYEVIRSEIKNDIENVLDSVKEIPAKLDNSKFDDRFNEIDSQFEQFRFILKNTTESILDKDSKTYEEVNSVINSLNAKFESLISELKDENIRTVDLLNEKISTSQEEVNRKIDSSVDLMDNKFETFLQGITEQNKYFETAQLDTIQSIIETNKINQKEILGYIKNLEQANAEFLNEIEAKKYNLENLKLKELDELISLQNQEIESLLNEKEDFINEVENFIYNKKEQLTNENILKLEGSIQDVADVLNAKIEDLEVEFGRKLQDLDLTSYFDYFDKTHSDFINSVQSQLSNNYEVVKNEIKNDIETVLDSVKEIPSKLNYSHKFNNDRFNEIDSQFEQFRFILKNTTESILDKDSKTYEEVNNVMNSLNTKFKNLISELKDENIRTVDLLNEKISTSQEEVNRKIDSSVDMIDDKFEMFLKEIKEQNKYFETTQLDTIQSIIETNKINQKEILGYIKNLEQANAEFLNEIEAKKYNLENLKLKEFEELISIQNQEIEDLLNEKEDFINEVETFILNKKNKLDSEHINRLEDSIKITMANFSDKITELERSFDKKISDIDLNSVSSLVSSEQANFFDSVQDSLSYNYELVRNEFKENLTQVLNTISTMNFSNENRLDQIDNQLENFRSLLKDVTENILNKEEKHYSQIDEVILNLNEEFKKAIKSIEIQNKKTSNFISNNIKNNNKKLLKKIDSSLSEMNANFDSLFDDLKITSKIIENNHVDTIETILELNQNTKKEIFEFVNLLEGSNQKLVNDVLQIQNKKDSIKLKELEELIDIQNQELEALIDDKNDFINEIEKFVKTNKINFNENNALKLENSIENLIKIFNKKIDEFEANFNDKFTNLNSLDSLKDSQQQLNEIKNQLIKNYESIKNILQLDLNKIVDGIQSNTDVQEHNFEKINSKFNEFKNALQNLPSNKENSYLEKINNLAISLNSEFDDLVRLTSNDDLNYEKLDDSSSLVHAKFDLFINKLDEKIKSLQQNELVSDFKKWWTDFKNNNVNLFTQGDSINLVLDSNKINQNQINEYINKLEKQNDYLKKELKKEQDKFSILKIKEIEELIDFQNNEISTLLNDWEKLIFELERYLQNILNITDQKYDESNFNEISTLNSSLTKVINDFKNKIDVLENNFKNKVLNINKSIDLTNNEEILKIQKNLFDNYSFLKNDLDNVFKNILFKIDEIKNSTNNQILKSKINDLIIEIENIKNATNTSVKELNDKNLFLDKIENFVTEKFENKEKENQNFKNLYENNDYELTKKLNKLDDWYSSLINHIENNNKDIINAYIDNKINEIKIENDFDDSNLTSTYQEIISKLSEISNLLNLSKDNASKIIKNLFENYHDKDKLINLLSEFNKIVISNNKIIENLSYQNNKYLESINLAYQKNTLFEIGKELVGVLDLLSKSQSLLNADFADFELEQKALNEILLKPFNLEVITNFIVRVSDLLKNNIDLLTRLFLNFERKKDANLIKLHAIQDSLKTVSEELKKLDDYKIDKQNFVSFNEKLDEIKNTLLISHLDLKVFKESEIEKTLLSSNSDVLKIEFKKIVLLEDLIKYSKDYLKNILSQKNKLVKILIKENQSDDANCLVEFKASQLYDELSAKVTEDQIKGFNEIIKEFGKSADNSGYKTDLISAKNLKSKTLLYAKISELELEIVKLFEIIESKKKIFLELLSDILSNNSDSEVQKIISRFEDSKEMIQNEYFHELEAFKNQIFSFKDKELQDFKNEISNLENEINNFKNSDEKLLIQREKELEPLDNLIEEIHLEINSFEQEKENHYKEVAEKLAYLNSLGSSKEKSFEDTVNTDKFKINLNNEVKKIIEDEFTSFKKTFLKNLEQIKNGFNLVKSSYVNSDNEIDNPSWFTSFDEKVKNIENDIISEKINSEKNVNKNNNNNIELEINGEKVKSFIVETESKKKEIEDFYKKIRDLIELRKTKEGK